MVHDEVLAEAEGQVGAQGAGEGLAAAVEGHEVGLPAGTGEDWVRVVCSRWYWRATDATEPTCSAAPRAADAP